MCRRIQKCVILQTIVRSLAVFYVCWFHTQIQEYTVNSFFYVLLSKSKLKLNHFYRLWFHFLMLPVINHRKCYKSFQLAVVVSVSVCVVSLHHLRSNSRSVSVWRLSLCLQMEMLDTPEQWRGVRHLHDDLMGLLCVSDQNHHHHWDTLLKRQTVWKSFFKGP